MAFSWREVSAGKSPMAAQGNYGFSGEGSTFVVFDVSNPAAPTPIARLAMPGPVQDVAVFSANGRQYAAVANYDAGLQVVDITTPTAPALRGYYNTGDYASGIAVFGSNAFLANGNSGLMILDVSNPLQPQEVATLSIGDVIGSGFNTSGYKCLRLRVRCSGSRSCGCHQPEQSSLAWLNVSNHPIVGSPLSCLWKQPCFLC